MKLYIHGEEAEWVKRVVINGQFLEWSKVVSGVPQGSVWGPLLFNLFINDIEFGIKSSILVFADDTKLCSKITSTQVIASLQEDLDKIGGWADTWQIRLNIKKWKCMHLGAKNKHQY